MNFNCSPISKAIVKNDVEAFKELLNKRKRIDIPDNLGYTSLHIAAKKSASSIDPYILDTLLNHPDVEINSKTVEGFTSVYIACNCKTPNIEAVTNFLVHGADPNISDNEQVTPLHVACKFGDMQLVKLLLKYNANINSKDFNAYTPLHYAIEYKFDKIVEHLVKSNADANIQNLHGLNALMYAVENRQKVAGVLVEYTKDLETRTRDHMTALQLAIKRDDLGAAELLIKKGADLYETEALLQALKKHNFPMFHLIWRNVEPGRLKKYEEIFRKVLICCNAGCDFRFLRVMLDDERLVSDLRGRKGVLAFVFYKGTNLNVQYTREYFQMYKLVYVKLFSCLVNQGVGMSSADVESFIFYFHSCPYRIDLLKQLLDSTKPDITEHLVIYAFEYDMKMGALLMQHCLDVYPENLFDNFRHLSRLQTDVWQILEYVLKYFTPSKAHRKRIVEKLLITDCNPTNTDVYKLLNYKKNVKSLKELSRDVIRGQFQEVCETSSEFLERVELLEIPTVIKDYIRLKLCVRSA